MTTKISARSTAAKRAKARRANGKKVRDFLDVHAKSNRHTCDHLHHRSGRLPVIYNTYNLYPHALPDILTSTGLSHRPKWDDIDLRSQEFIMTKAMSKERCVTINCNVHPDFESKVMLSGERFQDVFIERLTKKLKSLGFPGLLYHFVFEAADKRRQPRKLHIHGTARVPSNDAWEALELALAYASGNQGKRRTAGAVMTKGYRDEGWLRYCLKNERVADVRLPGRRVHFSSAAREAGKGLLSLVTADRSSIRKVMPIAGAVAVGITPPANSERQVALAA